MPRFIRSASLAFVPVLFLALGAARAQEGAPPASDPTSLDEAMRIGELRRVAARQAALKAVQGGDPVEAFLALDRAMELAPADAELLHAKKSIEADAVAAGLKRAARLGGEGDVEGAFRLLAALYVASEDPRLEPAMKSAKRDYEAAIARGEVKRPEERPAGASAPALTATPAPISPSDRTITEPVRDLRARMTEVERRLDRLSTSPTLAAKAEPAVDALARQQDDSKRDLERALVELRRDHDVLQREVESLRREVERLRARP